MNNGSSRQHSASSQTLQRRRSARLLSRGSANGAPDQDNTRRSSSRVNPNGVSASEQFASFNRDEWDLDEQFPLVDEDGNPIDLSIFNENGYDQYSDLDQHRVEDYLGNNSLAVVPGTSLLDPILEPHFPQHLGSPTSLRQRPSQGYHYPTNDTIAPGQLYLTGNHTAIPTPPTGWKGQSDASRAYLPNEVPSEDLNTVYGHQVTYPEPPNDFSRNNHQIYQGQGPYYTDQQWFPNPVRSSRELQRQVLQSDYAQPLAQQGRLDLPANPYHDGTARHNPTNYPARPKKTGHRDKTTPSAIKDVSVFDHEVTQKHQKPKVAAFNKKVRINNTTQGLTTRTAKINEYDPRKYYTYSRHPLGDGGHPHGAPWKHPGSRYTHRYKDSSLSEDDGGPEIAIYELEDRQMDAAKLEDFILNYPSDRNTLTLRIQVTPGDSGRRYNNDADKCRFKTCPLREAGYTATIKHGWYRIAFDERNDDQYDPFAANCGFVHLYCMERFLDFEYICQRANVQIEFRNRMPKEPGGSFAAAFKGSRQQHPGDLAEKFVQYARDMGVRHSKWFRHYPVFREYSGDVWDHRYAFENTLSYHMMVAADEKRPYAQCKQFSKAGLKASQSFVNRGDLGMLAEVQNREKQLMRMSDGKKKGSYKPDGNGVFDVEVRRRIQRAWSVLEVKEREAKARKNKSKARPPPGRVEDEDEDEEEPIAPGPNGKEPWQVGDDESDVEPVHPPRTGTRRSERNKGKQPNYGQEIYTGHYEESQPQRPLPKNYQQYPQPAPQTYQFPYVPPAPELDPFPYPQPVSDYNQLGYPQNDQYNYTGLANQLAGQLQDNPTDESRRLSSMMKQLFDEIQNAGDTGGKLTRSTSARLQQLVEDLQGDIGTGPDPNPARPPSTPERRSRRASRGGNQQPESDTVHPDASRRMSSGLRALIDNPPDFPLPSPSATPKRPSRGGANDQHQQPQSQPSPKRLRSASNAARNDEQQPTSATSRRFSSSTFNDLFYDTPPSSPARTRKRPSRDDDEQQQEQQQPLPSPKRTRSSSIRRRSSARSTSLTTPKRASFEAQPVSKQRTFHADAPTQSMQPRMLKELEGDAGSPRTPGADAQGRTLRSGRSIGSIAE